MWRGILSGRSCIKNVSRFPVDSYYAEMAACIENLKEGGNKSSIYDLIDRVLLKAGTIPSDTFLVTASTKAGIDRILDLYKSPGGSSDECFPPYIGDYIQEKLSLSGDSLHVSAACASSTVALAKGAALIESGRCESVLVCCFDLVTEFVFSGFCSVQAMTPSYCMPFDKDRKGMSIGEGAAFLMLMAPEKAKELNKKSRGILSGWGITNDATHITRPDRDGLGLSLAIEKSLERAEISADSVSAICAHGTGTFHNDHMELASYKSVFGEDNIPIFSVKGAIGHTLGAAGGIEAALSLECLSRGTVLPTIGFSTPEKGAEGLVSSEPVKKDISYILSTNSGFAGVNGAVLIGRGVE